MEGQLAEITHYFRRGHFWIGTYYFLIVVVVVALYDSMCLLQGQAQVYGQLQGRLSSSAATDCG